MPLLLQGEHARRPGRSSARRTPRLSQKRDTRPAIALPGQRLSRTGRIASCDPVRLRTPAPETEDVPVLVELRGDGGPSRLVRSWWERDGRSAKIEGGTAVPSNVPVAEATLDEMVLPERVQDALGQLVGAAREGLLALSVNVGLGVLSELLEEEVTELVGPKGKWNLDRTAIRHGHKDGEVTLGGWRSAWRRAPIVGEHQERNAGHDRRYNHSTPEQVRPDRRGRRRNHHRSGGERRPRILALSSLRAAEPQRRARAGNRRAGAQILPAAERA